MSDLEEGPETHSSDIEACLAPQSDCVIRDAAPLLVSLWGLADRPQADGEVRKWLPWQRRALAVEARARMEAIGKRQHDGQRLADKQKSNKNGAG